MTPTLAAAALGLGSILPPPPAEPVAPNATHLYADLDVAGRGEQSWPEDGLSTLITLPRGRVELGLGGDRAGARVALEPVRSGGTSSPLGVDGESILGRYQIAEAWVRWPRLGLRGGAGIIDDPWVVTANTAWGLRAAGATLGEATGWLDRSDLGAIGAWTAPGGVLSVVGSLTSGEGARFSERNDGKDTTAMAILRPLAFLEPDQAPLLEAAVMVREGSRGLASARDHRAAARVTSTLGPATLGAEAILVRGLAGDADATPQGWSAWGRAALPWDTLAFARADQTTQRTGEADTTATTVRGGLGWRPAPSALLLLGVEHTRSGTQAVPIAGADGAAQSTAAYALLGVRTRAMTDIQLLEN